MYELYSILVHSGSALGGHYYAYIWSFKEGCWLEFNDSHVSSISSSTIEGVFGRSESTSSSYSYGSNAYMLVYRMVDPSRNKEEPTEVPQNLADMMSSEKKKKREKTSFP